MINTFEDFCLYRYVVVDDAWQQCKGEFKRPGPPPKCSDSELLTIALVGECRGWVVETELLKLFGEHRDLFPNLPSQSRFNRRRRQLRDAFNRVRLIVLNQLDLAEDRQCVIDSMPVPAVKFHLVPGSTGDWAAHGATFGKVPSKKQTIFGFKLHLLTTLGGLIRDFILAPAHCSDLAVGADLLDAHTDLVVCADKGYLSAPLSTELARFRHIRLLALRRANQKQPLPPALSRLIERVRQIVETVNAQLTEQFQLAVNHAHSVDGLCTRLLAKLTAHTLCIFINRLLKRPNFLHIKALAFPSPSISHNPRLGLSMKFGTVRLYCTTSLYRNRSDRF